jgi:hypothetical protein
MKAAIRRLPSSCDRLTAARATLRWLRQRIAGDQCQVEQPDEDAPAGEGGGLHGRGLWGAG